MNKLLTRGSVVALATMIGIAASAQRNPAPVTARTGSDSSRSSAPGMRPSTSTPRPYKDVITSKAISSYGMFTIHKVDERYFFEIPDNLLGRDILVVARVAKAAAGVRGQAGYAGDQINQNTIRFEKGPANKIFLRSLSYTEVGHDSTEGMYRNLMNSSMQPIGAAFDIKAYAKDSAASVIDVTDYIAGDNDYFFFAPSSKRGVGIGAPQADKSYIVSARAFKGNIELQTVKTYTRTPTGGGGMGGGVSIGSGSPVTFELNTSLVLLPEVPMQPRYFDDRIGYFTTQQITDFDKNSQGIDRYRFIARYRLEPKPEDVEKYKRGELVEPKKQIVYYIDPTTPKKWIPYLIAGVNDWQAAFEKAGFKNAIVAKVAPTYAEDSTFSLEDASHSAIIYKPSDIPNASGPNIHDPRSGEIMESHVNWYHNVMSLVRNWYMIQTAAVDPKARKMTFDDELMGQLIRFVSSHEIGHTLGLRHNFGSSSTTPVEKLRDKAWVEANGHTASIMDYARFNYVAQPEDNITEKGLFPRIGEYDKWAIEWGYRWFPEAKNADQETPILNKWTIEKLSANKRLWWGDGESNREDPRSQTEDLGDNAMKASTYGLKNLKLIITRLPEYTKVANEDYDNLATIYSEITNQFRRYIGHVANNVGGIERTPKRIEQSGPVYEFTPKATQKEAMAWIQANVFTTPTWAIQKNYINLTGQDPAAIIGGLQTSALGNLVSESTITNLLRFEMVDPATAYGATEMLNDVRKGVFTELATRKAIDAYRRQLQKTLVDRLITLAHPAPPQTLTFGGSSITISSGFSKTSDGLSVVKGQLRALAAEIKTAAAAYTDTASKNHLLDLQDRIREALDPK